MTLHIDLQFAGIGRIHQRSGTDKKSVRNAMQEAFRLMYQTGKLEHLRDLKAGRISPMVLYERYRTGTLDRLATGDLVRQAETAYQDWLDGKVIAANTRKDYEEARTRVLAFGDEGAMLADLPALLEAHRRASIGTHPRTFNQDRAAWLSFLKRQLGETHWLTADCRRVEKLPMPDDRRMPFNPQTVAQVRELARRFGERGQEHHALTLWGLALTGMRPEEYFEEGENRWTLEPDRVRIDGTKTKAARRYAPRLGLLVKPATKRVAFWKALGKIDPLVTPYDLRRSYAQWLDDARIPVYRQKYYFGHGPKDVTQLYQRMKDCLPHLAADTAALLELTSEPTGLRVVK